MTDASLAPPIAALRSIDYYSAEASARVRRRYASERRFKLLGLLAIAVAGLFVIVLLGDIIRKGMPAFFEHSASLEVTLDATHIDAKGARDPADLRAGDYQAVVREALRNVFPDVTDRRARRQLEGLISSGAADDLRAMVLRDPSLVGRTMRVPLLLSDDADLYMKGIGTKVRLTDGQGSLAIKSDDKEFEFSVPSNGFASALGVIKRHQLANVAAFEIELARLSQSGGQSEQLTARRAELTQRIADIRRKAGDQNAAETLDASQPSVLIEFNGGLVKLAELSPTSAKGTQLIAPKEATPSTNAWKLAIYETPESNRRVSDAETAWLETFKTKGAVDRSFAWRFFTNGDSREPELAGIRGALIGSALTLLVTLALCLPIGVAAAIYLEEFAPKNRFTDLLEVNINNLAAVPSIVFGLLGLAMFLNFFNLPRSAPLVGGLVLALLVLPTIIIASRAALKAVPPSIKEAALGVGASHQQAIFHHVLPLAMPGIMTGTIIGMAHALGETAPLLMIGMVAFIVEIPKAITDAATVLPVQIYLWSDLPEVAFQSKTAATIMVLLGFLFVMNGLAIVLRRRFERRW